MKKLQILGHVFEMEDRAHAFLERYIDRIKEHTSQNNISTDVSDDILYSLIEKLYKYETPITEKQVIETANHLGEPEDIFGNENIGGSDTTKKDTKEGILSKDKPVIRGVCYRLAKSLGISTLIVRLVFIVTTLLYGTSIWIYLILALFVPYENKKKTTGRVGNIFFEIVRIILRLFVISIIIPVILGIVAATGFLFFTPSFDGQSITALLPSYIYAVLSITSVALLVLGIGAIGGLFKQEWINKTLALIAVVISIIGGLIIGGTAYKIGFTLAKNHSTIEQQTISLSGSSIDTNTLDINIIGEGSYIGDRLKPYIRFVPTSGNTVYGEIRSSATALTQDILNIQKEKINPIVVSGDDNHIDITIPDQTFEDTVPFAFATREITIYIPNDKNIVLNNKNRINTNLSSRYITQQSEDGKRWRDGYCIDKVNYTYDAISQRFVCQNVERETRHHHDYDEYDEMDDYQD